MLLALSTPRAWTRNGFSKFRVKKMVGLAGRTETTLVIISFVVVLTGSNLTVGE